MKKLLIHISAVIIVATAILIFFPSSEKFQHNDSRQNIEHDILTITEGAQAYFMKPVLLGGGGFSYENFNLRKINFQSPNINGTYNVQILSKTELMITAIGTNKEKIMAIIGPKGRPQFLTKKQIENKFECCSVNN